MCRFFVLVIAIFFINYSFNIKPSGDIMVKSSLDKNRQYIITVNARDQGLLVNNLCELLINSEYFSVTF